MPGCAACISLTVAAERGCQPGRLRSSPSTIVTRSAGVPIHAPAPASASMNVRPGVVGWATSPGWTSYVPAMRMSSIPSGWSTRSSTKDEYGRPVTSSISSPSRQKFMLL
jgi:hypothetical protein